MTSANKQPFVAREKLKDEEVGCGMQRVEGKVGNKKINNEATRKSTMRKLVKKAK